MATLVNLVKNGNITKLVFDNSYQEVISTEFRMIITGNQLTIYNGGPQPYVTNFSNITEQHGATDADGLVQYWGENDFFNLGSGGGGVSGVVVVNSNHIFADIAARDEYFDPTQPVGNPTDNTAELVLNETAILVGGDQLQVWTGTTDPVTYDNTNWNTELTLRTQVDWNETNTNSFSFILNKPTIPDSVDDLIDGGGFVRMTDAERTKLTSVSANAEQNVNPDWNAVSGDGQILNKPTDLTDLSTHNVTELSDVSNAGSGAIITAAERTNLQSSFNNAAIQSGTTLRFTKNDTTTQDVTIPPGILSLGDVEITSDLSINSTNLATYSNRTITSRGAALTITVTLDTIANFILASTGEFFITFVNEGSGSLVITASGGDNIIGNLSMTLGSGRSITIKYPQQGNVWGLVTNSITAGAGGTPSRPDPQVTSLNAPLVLEDDQGADFTWDASSGEFPNGAQEGYTYRITTAGTVDGQAFATQDLLIAIVDNPSTSTFSSNWHRLNGATYVHSWGGLTGAIDDREITTVLTRLGFVASAPSAHNFTINIPSRVDVGTGLNDTRILNFDVTNRNAIATTELIVTPGDNKTLTNPTRDGNQAETVILSGIDTSVQTTITFLIRITDTSSTTHDSNTVTVEVRNLATHEQVHFGSILSTEDQTDIDFSQDDILTRDSLAGDYSVSGLPGTGTHRLYIAVPTSLGSVTSVFQGSFNLTSQFTNVPSVTIDAQTYNIFLMNAESAVTSLYNGTILTIT